MNFIDYGTDLAEPWHIGDYGNPEYVNILDAHGSKVVWTIERHRATRISEGMTFLAAAEVLEAMAEQLRR